MKSAKSKKSQRGKFEDVARELETERSEQHFDTMLKRIAKAKRAPYDEMVTRAGKGAVVRSAKPLKPKR